MPTLSSMQNTSRLQIVGWAESDNKVLSLLTNRWMDNGNRPNPFPDLVFNVRSDRMLLVGWTIILASIVYAFCMVLWTWPHISPYGFFDAAGFMAGGVSLFLGVKFGDKVKDRENMRAFTDSVGLLLWIYWTEGTDRMLNRKQEMWEDAAFMLVPALCEMYLTKLAASVRGLEPIPWRGREKEELGEVFDRHFDFITILTELPRKRGRYFKPEEKVSKANAVFSDV